MKKLGLIGRNISYSFSKHYFDSKFSQEEIVDFDYQLFDLHEIEEVEPLFLTQNLIGFNVTIPFKEQIISYLDELSLEAQKVGAVNCVKIQKDKKIGFNTDVYGFEKSIKPLLNNQHQKALILGDGGAAKAVKFVLDNLEIPYQIVKRNSTFNFSDLNQQIIENHQLIINCTPLGTFPNIEDCPDIPYEFLSENHLLYDLIYNPEKSKFLRKGEERGTQIKNGLQMLELQAEKSWEIWNHPL